MCDMSRYFFEDRDYNRNDWRDYFEFDPDELSDDQMTLFLTWLSVATPRELEAFMQQQQRKVDE